MTDRDSPQDPRGRLVALNQLNIVAGILIAFLCNYVIAQLLPPAVASAIGGALFCRQPNRRPASVKV